MFLVIAANGAPLPPPAWKREQSPVSLEDSSFLTEQVPLFHPLDRGKGANDQEPDYFNVI